MFSEKAFIWSEWGDCNQSTCLQRRKRACVDATKCKAIGTEGDDDYVEAGWEKFDRKCMDHEACFASVTAVEAGKDPMEG